MKTLVLEPMGCNIDYARDNQANGSDLLNHRYYIHGLRLNKETKEKFNVSDYETMTIEVIAGSGFEIIKNKIKRTNKYCLCVGFYFHHKDGVCVGNSKMEMDLSTHTTPYTKEELLKVINNICNKKFDNVKDLARG